MTARPRTTRGFPPRAGRPPRTGTGQDRGGQGRAKGGVSQPSSSVGPNQTTPANRRDHIPISVAARLPPPLSPPLRRRPSVGASVGWWGQIGPEWVPRVRHYHNAAHRPSTMPASRRALRSKTNPARPRHYRRRVLPPPPDPRRSCHSGPPSLARPAGIVSPPFVQNKTGTALGGQIGELVNGIQLLRHRSGLRRTLSGERLLCLRL